MAKPPPSRPLVGADNRPRFYIAAESNNRVHWRHGYHGGRNFSGTAGQALDEILRVNGSAKPAVIFWEGGPFE